MQSWPKLQLDQVGIDSNITQNHSFSPKEVIYEYCLPHFTCKIDQRLGSHIWSLLKAEINQSNTLPQFELGFIKSYLASIYHVCPYLALFIPISPYLSLFSYTYHYLDLISLCCHICPQLTYMYILWRLHLCAQIFEQSDNYHAWR